jgi:hypothetical protein
MTDEVALLPLAADKVKPLVSCTDEGKRQAGMTVE